MDITPGWSIVDEMVSRRTGMLDPVNRVYRR